MGAHADCEYFLGSDPFIVTVSFGATRTLHFLRNTKQRGIKKTVAKVNMKDRSVMVMHGSSIQCYFSHSLPKIKNVGERWSLSFCYHINK